MSVIVSKLGTVFVSLAFAGLAALLSATAYGAEPFNVESLQSEMITADDAVTASACESCKSDCSSHARMKMGGCVGCLGSAILADSMQPMRSNLVLCDIPYRFDTVVVYIDLNLPPPK